MSAFITTRFHTFDVVPWFDAFGFEVGDRADGTMREGFYDKAFWDGSDRARRGKRNPAVGWIAPSVRAEHEHQTEAGLAATLARIIAMENLAVKP